MTLRHPGHALRTLTSKCQISINVSIETHCLEPKTTCRTFSFFKFSFRNLLIIIVEILSSLEIASILNFYVHNAYPCFKIRMLALEIVDELYACTFLIV